MEMFMKRKLMLTIMMCISVSVFSQMIDQTVAVVEITKRTMLSKRQLDSLYIQYNQQLSMTRMMLGETGGNNITKQQVLQLWIVKQILLQTAEKNGTSVTDKEAENAIKREILKELPAQHRNESGIRKAIQVNFKKDYEDYMNENVPVFKEKLIIDKYLLDYKSKELQDAEKVSEEDMQKAFDMLLMQGKLNRPVFFKLNHIVMKTKDLDDASQQAVYDQMIKLEKLIDGKVENFFKYVPERSEDHSTKYKKGYIGWITAADPNDLSYYGEIFFELFNMKKNSISKVLKSRDGYHIFYLSDKLLPDNISLDSLYNAKANMTFRTVIQSQLVNQKKEMIIQQAKQEIYNKEKVNAYIEIFDQELK
jgi:parvulin-like peptidyl-prolyl isomerase